MSSALRRSLLLAVPVALAAGLTWLLILRGGGEHAPSAASVFAQRQAALGRCLQERAHARAPEDGRERECPGAPESSEDLGKIGEAVTSRLGSSDSRGELSRAIAQR